jgi:hypothetical protein
MVACSGPNASDCEMFYQYSKDKKTINYGNYLLNDSNDYWLNYPQSGSSEVTFKNEQDFALRYLVSGYKSYRDLELRRYNKGEVERCVGQIINVDYFNSQYEILKYGPINNGNVFEFYRYQDIKWESIPIDSFKVAGKTEFLQFKDSKYNSYEWNYISRFYTDTLMQSPSQKYHQSILLRGKEFRKIIELINLKADSLKIEVKGYYYSFEDGLVGYYLTNDELWLRD